MKGETAIPRRRRLLVAAAVCGLMAACADGRLVLTDQIQAQRLASALHLEFSRTNEAAHRAVMAETDEASAAAAGEARQTSAAADQAVAQLRPLVESLAYRDELALLEQFGHRFDEFKRLDAE